MKALDINDFKGRIKSAILDWGESKIDALFPNKPQVRSIMKNGMNNMLHKIDNCINSYVDNIILFVGDKDGNIDSDSMVDMAVSIFEEMEQTEFKAGMFDMRVGKGEFIVDLPHNIFLDMLVGSLGSVRFTSEDLKEFKNLLN